MTRSFTLIGLWDLMKTLHAGTLLDLQSFLSANCVAFQPLRKGKSLDLEPASYERILDKVRAYKAAAEEADLPLCAGYAGEALEALEAMKKPDGSGRITGQIGMDFASSLEQIANIAGRELNTRLVFALPAESARQFAPPKPPFGPDFNVKFPDAIYDLDEAGKCLGLGRSTAAVFHLMRIVESGLRAVYLCLGITAALKGRNRNWSRIFEKIDKAIADKAKVAGGGWSEKNKFQELRIQIAAVGDAWRNPTMHVGTKRTPEEAQEIFDAVQALMRKISLRMDEQGHPRA